MEHVSSIFKTVSLNVKREESQAQSVLNPHITDVVNKLFVFFYSICRGFEKQYQDPKRLNIEKTQWIKAFMDLGFDTLEKIQFGIKKCRFESPINTPTIGQFIKWCTPSPEDLGIPHLEAAYEEAILNSYPGSEKKWSHPAVYHAWSMCKSHELSSLPKKSTWPIFERNYAITIEMLIRGESLKAVPIALPSTKKEDARKAIASGKGFEHCQSSRTAMQEMRKLLRGHSNGL